MCQEMRGQRSKRGLVGSATLIGLCWSNIEQQAALFRAVVDMCGKKLLVPLAETTGSS
jgi:hypothetical protein